MHCQKVSEDYADGVVAFALGYDLEHQDSPSADFQAGFNKFTEQDDDEAIIWSVMYDAASNGGSIMSMELLGA
jgi:hypothetical protein